MAEKECAHCSGGGVCPTCGGNGTTISMGVTSESCTECGGSGKCKICGGAGKVEAPDEVAAA